jgi:hypothetical protein
MRYLLAALLLCAATGAYAIDDESAVRAIMGEASNQGYHGMLAVAVGIRNRDTLKGVYGVKAKHVDRESEYTWGLARMAWEESEHNRIHTGTHWENVEAFGMPYWAKEMEIVYEHRDHVFFERR